MIATLHVMGELKRLEGWEKRLAELVERERAMRQVYRLGEHDCFRVACAAIEALTGVDAWPQFRGRYSTKRGALALLAQYGSSFTAAFSAFFGSEPVPIAQARRGDIAEYREACGEAHLGVIVGGQVMVLGELALYFLPRSSCAHAWRVG